MKNLKSVLMISVICLLPLTAEANYGSGNEKEKTGFFQSMKNSFSTSNDEFGRYDNEDNGVARPMALSAARTRNMQQSLATRGFYKGRIDGIWGAQTNRAVHEYQTSAGLASDGVLTSSDLRNLDVTASNTDANKMNDITPAAGGYQESTYSRSSRTIRYTERVSIIKYGNSGTARGRQAFLE